MRTYPDDSPPASPPVRAFVDQGVRTRRLIVSAALAAILGGAGALLPAPVAAAAPAGRDAVLTGRIVGVDGRPVPGVRVSISDGAGGVFIFVKVFTCLFSGGFFLAPEVCGPHGAEATTDAQGRYRLVVPRRTPVAQPGERYFTASGRPVGPGGLVPTVSTTFAYRGGSGTLPTQTLWTTPYTVRLADGRVSFTPRVPPGATGTPVPRLRADDGGIAYGLVVDKSGRATVDQRVLEARTRSVDAYVEGVVAGRRTRWSSGSVAVPTVGTPVSRGRSCSTYVEGGQLVRLSTCPFTDGSLGRELGLHAALRLMPRNACERREDCDSPNSLVVDLGSLRTMRAVVLRGCACRIELSIEGALWTKWHEEKREGGRDAVVTGFAQPARYVRFVGDVFTTWHLRELSVWADPLPVPVPVPPSLVPAPAAPLPLPDVDPPTVPGPTPADLTRLITL